MISDHPKPAASSLFVEVHALICRACLSTASWTRTATTLSSRYALCVGCGTITYCEDVTLHSLEKHEREKTIPPLDTGKFADVVASMRALRA